MVLLTRCLCPNVPSSYLLCGCDEGGRGRGESRREPGKWLGPRDDDEDAAKTLEAILPR